MWSTAALRNTAGPGRLIAARLRCAPSDLSMDQHAFLVQGMLARFQDEIVCLGGSTASVSGHLTINLLYLFGF